jgi:hypothetical protein
MSTFADLKARVGRMLKDEQITDELIFDAVDAALDAILPWQAPRATQVITGDGTNKTFALSDDLYEIDAIQADDGEFLPIATLAPGLFRGASAGGENDWIEYPTGTLSLSKAPANDASVTVYYRAHWTKPANESNDDFVLTVPKYLEYPVALYAAAYALMPKSAQSANIRQFNTKVDSGNPGHNPVADRMTFILKLFRDEMNSHPRQIAGSRA